MTTRREMLAMFAAAGAGAPAITVPVRHLVDRSLKLPPAQLRHYWADIWPECMRAFAASHIVIREVAGEATVERPQGREPIIQGLAFGALNIVVTNQVPMEWDRGRSLGGVTTLYRGRPLCLISLTHVHGNLMPFVAVNTCVHEMLHAIMGDIWEVRPPGWKGEFRETRIDSYGTALWMLRDVAAVRESAAAFVARLSQGQGNPT